MKTFPFTLAVLCAAILCSCGHIDKGVKEQIQYLPADYFVVGTLQGYIGRPGLDRKRFQIDAYWYHDKVIAYHVARQINQCYGNGAASVETDISTGARMLYSKKAYENIDRLYSDIYTDEVTPGIEYDQTIILDMDKVCKDFIVFDDRVSERWCECPAYRLNNKSFATDEQAMAYMHGVFLRHGYALNDSLYYIGVEDSNAGRVFEALAKKYGFPNLVRLEKVIVPRMTMVVFSPTSQFFSEIWRSIEVKEEQRASADKMISDIPVELRQKMINPYKDLMPLIQQHLDNN